jgi:beta-glucanase (GH16 family)
MRITRLSPILTAAVVLGLIVVQTIVPAVSSAQTWKLVWSDEFDGPADTAPDPLKWGYDIGGGGWGNNELQTYTSRTQNSFHDGEGRLIIKAIRETLTGPDGIPRNFTSARLLTKGKFQQRYGRFEARIKVPFGQGIWPAFWMLGNDIDSVGWPSCGEIDVMEHVGREPTVNHGSLHGPGYSGGNSLSGRYTLPDQQRFADDFHVFAMEWEPGTIRFYVDDLLYATRTTSDVPASGRWVFDHPFFMIMNIAVGGNFPGNPDDTTVFPQTMIVDYVRVYARETRVPSIVGVSNNKKHLFVHGDNFDAESVILVDGEKQKTIRDPFDLSVLTGKKVAKRLGSGQTVSVQVRTGDWIVSEEHSFTKP